MKVCKKLSILVYCCIAILAVSMETQASEKASESSFHYNDYNQVLQNYVDEENLVDYESLKANPENLNSYLKRIAEVKPNEFQSWPGDVRLAFWINAYNAITLKVIIDHYPIKASWIGSLRFPKNSIRHIDGVWDEITHTVMGRSMTLNQIEHETIRKNFNEPRIHFAVNCASIGCPKLRREPYVASKLDSQLDDQVTELMNDPEKFRVESNTLYLNKILYWYGEDFVGQYSANERFTHLGKTERAVANFFYQYMSGGQKQMLEGTQFSVSYLDYDWSLNEQKG